MLSSFQEPENNEAINEEEERVSVIMQRIMESWKLPEKMANDTIDLKPMDEEDLEAEIQRQRRELIGSGETSVFNEPKLLKRLDELWIGEFEDERENHESQSSEKSISLFFSEKNDSPKGFSDDFTQEAWSHGENQKYSMEAIRQKNEKSLCTNSGAEAQVGKDGEEHCEVLNPRETNISKGKGTSESLQDIHCNESRGQKIHSFDSRTFMASDPGFSASMKTQNGLSGQMNDQSPFLGRKQSYQERKGAFVKSQKIIEEIHQAKKNQELDLAQFTMTSQAYYPPLHGLDSLIPNYESFLRMAEKSGYIPSGQAHHIPKMPFDFLNSFSKRQEQNEAETKGKCETEDDLLSKRSTCSMTDLRSEETERKDEYSDLRSEKDPKRRLRRLASEIQKSFHCPIENCRKVYG